MQQFNHDTMKVHVPGVIALAVEELTGITVEVAHCTDPPRNHKIFIVCGTTKDTQLIPPDIYPFQLLFFPTPFINKIQK